MRVQWWLVAVAVASTSVSAIEGQGFQCAQACSGACAQATCSPASGPGGSCSCSSGALRLDQVTFAAYCHSWGTLQPTCTNVATPAANVSAAMDLLPNRDGMIEALMAQNPFAAALVEAARQGNLQGGGGPVQGLIHDIQYNAATGLVTNSPAIPFSGQVVAANSGGVAIDITVQGDLGSLGFLMSYAATTAPAAIVPTAIQGLVTSGGLHGNLSVTGAAGQSQALVW
jgi:hypothetical protein